MSNEFIPLIEVLRELRSLAAKKSSGFFFVVTEENHSCIIRLYGGQIEEVVFRMLRNDEAVQRLSMVTAARARFQVDPASNVGNKGTLSADSRQWLLGGFESDLSGQPAPAVASTTASSAPPPSTGGSGPTMGQRKVIDDVALRYFGPIASMLCEEAFESGGELQQLLEQLAKNLSSADETQRFLKDVRAALAKV